MELNYRKTITVLTIILIFSLTMISYSGVFVPTTYERDSTSMAVQGIGQDMVNLFIVVPLLIVFLIMIQKLGKKSYYIFTGILFYILYSFIIYSFGVHFNRLFLFYCLTLGSALYVFILMNSELNRIKVEQRFSDAIPRWHIGIFLIFIALVFYFLWLKDIIPAILNNTIPKELIDMQVNPVHVLDISIVLPALITNAILLIKKQKLGYILTPVFLVFIIILAFALIAMVIMLKLKGVSNETSSIGFFALLIIISSILLTRFFRADKTLT